MIVEIQLGTIEQAERARSNDECTVAPSSAPDGLDVTFDTGPIKLDRRARNERKWAPGADILLLPCQSPVSRLSRMVQFDDGFCRRASERAAGR